jgi:YD repeat-containing protein
LFSGFNRLLTDGTYNYRYDAEGNMTHRTGIASGVDTEFTWDQRNRLTNIDTPQRETGHWRFDEDDTETVAPDEGPFGLDGTLTNGAVFDEANRAPNSASGASLQLDGVDDYVSMGDQDELRSRAQIIARRGHVVWGVMT